MRPMHLYFAGTGLALGNLVCMLIAGRDAECCTNAASLLICVLILLVSALVKEASNAA